MPYILVTCTCLLFVYLDNEVCQGLGYDLQERRVLKVLGWFDVLYHDLREAVEISGSGLNGQ